MSFEYWTNQLPSFDNTSNSKEIVDNHRNNDSEKRFISKVDNVIINSEHKQ